MSAPDVMFYRFGPFRLDPHERLLYCNGQPVPLTLKAIETLRTLVLRHGRLVTKDELLREVWPDVVVEENNLAQHISTLRRALAQGGDGPFIETVPKRGYRFVATVIEEAAPEATTLPPGSPSRTVLMPPPTPADPPPTPARASSWIVAAMGALVIVLVWATWATRPAGEAAGPSEAGAVVGASIPRIAVLPFVTLGGGNGDYLAVATAEELTSRLAGVEGLAVISSTSTRGYDRSGKTLRRIGADLGATYVLEGAIRRDGPSADTLRMIPKLIRAVDDVTVWAHQYDVPLAELEGVHADIARRITTALQIHPLRPSPPASRVTADADAYLAYLRGIAAFQQSWSDTGLQAQARRDLEEAVARDPRFALAWSWLAHVYSTQHDTGADRSPGVRAAAQRAARRAIELAPQQPEGRVALARVLTIDRNYEGALREIEAARRARPDAPDTLRVEAWLRQHRGDWDTSLALQMRAFELDPASTADLVAIHYLHWRDYPQAKRFMAIARAANRSAAYVPDAWLRFSETGDVAGAREVLTAALSSKAPADARVRGLLARLEWFDGQYARALALIRDMDPAGAWWAANFRFPASIASGQVYDSLADAARARDSYRAALAQLEAAAKARPNDYQVHAAMGLAAAGLGLADEAVTHGRRAVELLPPSRDAVEGPVYLYALASIHARLGQHGEAFTVLDRMFLEPGFYSEKWVERDPWFGSLRSHPAFTEHLARWASQKGSAIRAPRPR